MTVIAVSNPGVLYRTAEQFDAIPAAGYTPAVGDVVYFDSTGKVVASNAGAAGTAKCAGIITSIQGRGVSIMKRGHIGGFDVSGMAYAAKVYLSNTAGKLDTAAGTVSVVAGVVVPVSDETRTKVLYFEANWLSTL